MSSPTLNEQIDGLFERYTQPGSPGCAVLLAKDGQILHQRGYGLANVEHGVPITPDTVFNVGSEAKQFTALAVMLLVAEAKLALDDDIRAHLPEAPDFGYTITIRHLLHHTSGVRCSFPPLLMLGGWLEGDLTTDDDVFRLFTNQRGLNFRPGDEYSYANMGYHVLARIVARVAGTPFATFCQERLFDPLGMTGTTIQDSPWRLVPGRAQSYWQGDDGGFLNAPLADGVCGPTNVYTSIVDLARWDENFYTGKVGGLDLVRLMHEPGVLNDGTVLDYGCGLMVGPNHRHRRLQMVEHGGGHGGYVSALMRFPDIHLGVAVLFNVFNWGARSTALRVADIFLDAHPELLPEPAQADKPAGVPETIALSGAELEARAGRYFDARRAALREVTLDEGTLHLGGHALSPIGEDRFIFVESPETQAIFTSGPDGQASAVQIASYLSAYRYERVMPAALTQVDLQEMVGLYMSPELNVYWEIVLKENELRVRHQRYRESRLIPVFTDGFRDDWSEPAGYPVFYMVLVDRDEAGAIAGFHVSDERMRHLRFVRVEHSKEYER